MAEAPGTAAERLDAVRQRMRRAAARFGPVRESAREPVLVAVSKTFDAGAVTPLLEAGQRVFGENRVQEAAAKWPPLRKRYADIELHLVGPLQTNKAREAVGLFDVIESLDREKLAASLRAEMDRAGRELKTFVQVNIGGEPQKSGVMPDEAAAFVKLCRARYRLDVVGLMCIPPADQPPGPFFAHLATLGRAAGVEGLSMGMSADFETAIWMGATHVRVGSALFGARG